jgi:cob(I)alamin adenosyltransferase
LAKRPPNIDIILTGPEMPKSILDIADQVTEIRRSQRP